MAQDPEEGPKGSSWHSWVRGSPRTRSDEAAHLSNATDVDDLDVTLSWPGAAEDRSSDVDVHDDDHVAAMPAIDDDLDDLADGVDADDLLPVPLLPTIAGRVDALGALLRTIAMRVDSLAATTNAFRSAVTDRIDEYADVVTGLGRQADQNLEDYRRANERTVAELRRGLADHDELLTRATARLEELSADVATLVDLVRQVADTPQVPAPAAAPLTAAEDPVWAEEISAVRHDLEYLRGMIDVVVDTMPASSEGSAAPVLGDKQLERIVDQLASRAAPELGDKQLERIVDQLASRLLGATPPAPPPAPKPAKARAPRATPATPAKPTKKR